MILTGLKHSPVGQTIPQSDSQKSHPQRWEVLSISIIFMDILIENHVTESMDGNHCFIVFIALEIEIHHGLTTVLLDWDEAPGEVKQRGMFFKTIAISEFL